MSDIVDRFLDALDLGDDVEDLRLDAMQVRLLESIRRLIRREGERTMASLDNLTAAIAQLDADVTKEAADVTAALAALQATIDGLSVGAITQDQIDALTSGVQSADDAVNALDASLPAAPPAP